MSVWVVREASGKLVGVFVQRERAVEITGEVDGREMEGPVTLNGYEPAPEEV